MVVTERRYRPNTPKRQQRLRARVRVRASVRVRVRVRVRGRRCGSGRCLKGRGCQEVCAVHRALKDEA